MKGKKQKDFVPHRTKSHSVVPPKFAAAGRALVIPITEGIRLRLLCSAQRLPGDFCLGPHGSSQRPLPLCACGTRLLTRSLPILNVINCNHTAAELVCQLEKTAILPFLRFCQEAGEGRRNILIGCPKNKWSRNGRRDGGGRGPGKYIVRIGAVFCVETLDFFRITSYYKRGSKASCVRAASRRCMRLLSESWGKA